MYYIWAIWVLNSFSQLASDTDHFIHFQRDIRLFDDMDDMMTGILGLNAQLHSLKVFADLKLSRIITVW